MLETPVLFIIFNRPDLERQVLERIREVKPKKLFVVADGPRLHKPEDVEKCKQARAVIDDLVDWDCELYKNYSNVNLGCRDRVSSGITWFFEHVDEGIILEDDCLPDTSFFGYCTYWLRNIPENVFIISGTSFFQQNDGYSYVSKYPWIWGWATTKEKWSVFKNELIINNQLRLLIKKTTTSKYEYQYWIDKFRRVANMNVSSWYFVFLNHIWKHDGLGLYPPVNLITNLGFQTSSTNTINVEDKLSALPTKILSPNTNFQILKTENRKELDRLLFDKVYRNRGFRGVSIWERILYYVF